MTKKEWEKLKKEAGANQGFDFETFGKYFDKDGHLLPGMLGDYMKARRENK